MECVVGGAGRSLDFRVQQLAVGGALRDCVEVLVGIELITAGPIPFAVAPHDALALTVQFGRSDDPIAEKGEAGYNTRLTGIREQTASHFGAGSCTTLFALLTPYGAVRLLDARPLEEAPRVGARVADLLDASVTRPLESRLALTDGIDGKLRAFAAWLEDRATARRQQTRAAVRAGRAANRLRAAPTTSIDVLADEQCVSRRQLERDFRRWVGTSPRHLSRVARVQAVSRRAATGSSLADIAADVGFGDQAHMSRAVREITGLTPTEFVRSRRTPIASVFREATGGSTVYL
jgi:AraC-like DNA-binding protein